MTKWTKSSDKVPDNENPVSVTVVHTYRFKRYKPNSAQFKNGIIGRWQEFNGYGWSNTQTIPLEWSEMPERE